MTSSVIASGARKFDVSAVTHDARVARDVIRTEQGRKKRNVVFLLGDRHSGKTTAALALLVSQKVRVFRDVFVCSPVLSELLADIPASVTWRPECDDVALAWLADRFAVADRGGLPAPACLVLDGADYLLSDRKEVPAVLLRAFREGACANIWIIATCAYWADCMKPIRRCGSVMLLSTTTPDATVNMSRQLVPTGASHDSIRLLMTGAPRQSWVVWHAGGVDAALLPASEVMAVFGEDDRNASVALPAPAAALGTTAADTAADLL